MSDDDEEKRDSTTSLATASSPEGQPSEPAPTVQQLPLPLPGMAGNQTSFNVGLALGTGHALQALTSPDMVKAIDTQARVQVRQIEVQEKQIGHEAEDRRDARAKQQTRYFVEVGVAIFLVLLTVACVTMLFATSHSEYVTPVLTFVAGLAGGGGGGYAVGKRRKAA